MLGVSRPGEATFLVGNTLRDLRPAMEIEASACEDQQWMPWAMTPPSYWLSELRGQVDTLQWWI